MLSANLHSTMLCRVFIFSTATNCPGLEEILVNHLLQAGLSFYITDENMKESPRIDATLKQEIDIADITVFFVGTSLGTKKIQGKSLIEFSFDYVCETGKPILVYLTEEMPIEPEAIQFREMVSDRFKCGRICSSDNETTANVFNDIVKLIFSEKKLTSWTRADICKNDIENTISEIEELNKELLRVNGLIGEYENRLGESDRNALVGRLIDAGLRYNSCGKAHKFVVGYMPKRELQQNEFEYTYYLGRFAKHGSFRKHGHVPIYDRMLNVYWYYIRTQPFTWDMAMDWRAHINERDNRILKMIDKNAMEQWQVPSIDELMTLLTSNRCSDVYIDDTFFPNDTHWFWSSTKSEMSGQPSAYYIETNHCQVLIDSVAHYNGLLLCKPGQLRGSLLMEIQSRPNEDKLKQLKKANVSQRIFGVYMSILAFDEINPEDQSRIWKFLAKNGYVVSVPANNGARNLPEDNLIEKELSDCDYYVLILGELERRRKVDTLRVKQEIHFAHDLHIPIFIFTRQNSDEHINNLKSMLGIHYDIEINHFQSIASLLHAIPMALTQYGNDPLALGWIKNHHFETINCGIEEINRTFERVSDAKFYLEEFIHKCDVDGLRECFENSNILPPVPNYGINTRFVSEDAPIQRLMITKPAVEKEFPILYNTIINRFELQSRNDGNRVVRDNLLNSYWWTDIAKRTTYKEALAWAEEISELDGRDWRLPTVEELITLITAKRGTRKYMDEIVFHTGRWFWTGTLKNDSVFYIDFNYMPDAVRLERLVPENVFPTIRKKSALVISKIDHKSQNINAFVSYASEDNGFVQEFLQELITDQINFWKYRNGIKPGMHEWDTAVCRAMDESDVMFLIWSRAASDSDEVHNEWNYYLKTGRPIIILAFDETELPYRLDLVQRIQYKTEDRKKILQIIKQFIEQFLQ